MVKMRQSPQPPQSRQWKPQITVHKPPPQVRQTSRSKRKNSHQMTTRQWQQSLQGVKGMVSRESDSIVLEDQHLCDKSDNSNY